MDNIKCIFPSKLLIREFELVPWALFTRQQIVDLHNLFLITKH
jgi:hypothetical protein